MAESRFESSVRKIKQKYENKRKGIAVPKTQPKTHNKAPENVSPCVIRLKSTSFRIFGTFDKWMDLYHILEKQQFTCPYSGKLLQIGVNASVDHIIPRALRGSDDLSNLEWVDIKINRMKRDHTPTGFITIVRRIAKHTENWQLRRKS